MMSIRVTRIETIAVLGMDIHREIVRDRDGEHEQYLIGNTICETLEIAVLMGICIKYAGPSKGPHFLSAILRILGIPSAWAE